MTTLRQFTCDDLFRFNGINLDPLTEMYGLSFYLQYLARWPEYFMVSESPSGALMGYIMGKSEGQNDNWHGHVTAVTVGPQYRRLGRKYFFICSRQRHKPFLNSLEKVLGLVPIA